MNTAAATSITNTPALCCALLSPVVLTARCDETEHFDLLKHEGRGATEIDIIEIMPGEEGRLPLVTAPIERPYVAMTLQVREGGR